MGSCRDGVLIAAAMVGRPDESAVRAARSSASHSAPVQSLEMNGIAWIDRRTAPRGIDVGPLSRHAVDGARPSSDRLCPDVATTEEDGT